MKEPYAQLYRDMLAEIERHLQMRLSEKERVESCFSIAKSYCKKLKELIESRDFENESEEIYFFKNVKPEFACYIEYFVTLSDSLLFLPEERDRAIAFWEQERKRFNLFCNKHASFIRYYESGNQELDAAYFLRENNELKFVPDVLIYDADPDWSTSHDRLVRNYLAYRMYSKYCDEKQFELLKQKKKTADN